MTIIIRILVLALTALLTTVKAQDFQGVATYKTQRKVDIKMDSTQMNSDMQAKMMEMMKKQFQKTYLLTFDKEASIYKEEESLDKPQMGGNGFEIQMFGGGGADVLFKNTKEKRYTDQKDTMGKIFLVKDELDPINWKLESDSKYIGEYQCYKATFTKMIEKFEVVSTSGTSNEDEKDEDKVPEFEERTITAWYTPQIPINNGPAMYQGLPGLILEVHDGKLTVICSKIVLNPEDKITIEEPSKGKEVNQDTYDEIMEQKAKEMMERYAPRKGGKGERIEIRIGG
jgi:GLPGLI family protein